MKKKEKKIYNDDDGRVIAPMNVDGMPWYNRHAPKIKEEMPSLPPEKMSGKDTLRLLLRLYAALIPVALVFIAAFAALIYFMVYVWLR
ncbi:MAG: hypothetical protein EOM87_04175 [Clostridia bacterium]|nr:hypothetical protein [Clostridia bacterium]